MAGKVRVYIATSLDGFIAGLACRLALDAPSHRDDGGGMLQIHARPRRGGHST